MTVTRPTTWVDLADTPPIDGLRFRRPQGTDADYAAMAAVVGAANRHDGIEWLPTAANLREETEASAGVDLAADAVLTEIDGAVVAESGVERVVRGDLVVFETWGHVVPEARRRGLGGVLLAENLRRAAERAQDEPEGTAPEVRSYVDQGEAGHRRLVEAAGLTPVRYFFLMRRPTLDDIPDAPLPDGLVLRPVTPDQHRAIWEAEVEAFRDHWQARVPSEEDFEVLFRKEDIDTSLWVVAWDGNDVAGVVQNWIWADENEQLGLRRGWLEHISVRRPWRQRGLGRAITAESLRRLRAAGMTEAMLGVDAENPTGALGLYERLGFEVQRRTTAYSRPVDR